MARGVPIRRSHARPRPHHDVHETVNLPTGMLWRSPSPGALDVTVAWAGMASVGRARKRTLTRKQAWPSSPGGWAVTTLSGAVGRSGGVEDDVGHHIGPGDQ
jgi:hypothetical protein